MQAVRAEGQGAAQLSLSVPWRAPGAGDDEAALVGEPRLGVESGLEGVGCVVQSGVRARVAGSVPLARQPDDFAERSLARHSVTSRFAFPCRIRVGWKSIFVLLCLLVTRDTVTNTRRTERNFPGERQGRRTGWNLVRTQYRPPVEMPFDLRKRRLRCCAWGPRGESCQRGPSHWEPHPPREHLGTRNGQSAALGRRPSGLGAGVRCPTDLSCGWRPWASG